MSDLSISPKHKIKQANEVVKHLNRASRNLMPGYSSTNRSVSSNRDPHLVKIKHTKQFVETPGSSNLAEKASIFIKKSYDPKIKENLDGKKIYQSSSISNNPKESFYEVPKALLKKPEKSIINASQKAPSKKLDFLNSYSSKQPTPLPNDNELEKIYQKGYIYLRNALDKEAKGIDLLESEHYENLCDVIDYLEKYDKTRRYYNSLASEASELQNRFNSDQSYRSKL